MSEDQNLKENSQPNIWLRGFYMLLMGLAFQVAGPLMVAIAVIQFILHLINDAPNARLLAFGRSLGRYLQQIANFMTFASDEAPFPFNDWPSSEPMSP